MDSPAQALVICGAALSLILLISSAGPFGVFSLTMAMRLRRWWPQWSRFYLGTTVASIAFLLLGIACKPSGQTLWLAIGGWLLIAFFIVEIFCIERFRNPLTIFISKIEIADGESAAERVMESLIKVHQLQLLRSSRGNGRISHLLINSTSRNEGIVIDFSSESSQLMAHCIPFEFRFTTQPSDDNTLEDEPPTEVTLPLVVETMYQAVIRKDLVSTEQHVEATSDDRD